MKVVVLGAGRVGGAIAVDLAVDERFEVTVADCSPEALERVAEHGAVSARQADLGDRQALEAVISDHNLVVGALPSFLGYETLVSAIECGKNCVDVSFLEEDPFALDESARSAGVTVVVDCGVSPGLSNLILGHHLEVLDQVQRFTCYVGGLPQRREPPWEYKVPYSPGDVLAVYTRPARYRVSGEEVVEEALSGLEEVEVEGVGTLEAFNTDGLRTLLTTVDVPNMVEKTLRYPGHAERIRLVRESGFLSPEPMRVEGVSVTPLAVTSELLFKQWLFEPGEPDLTIMRIVVEGHSNGEHVRRTHDLLDFFDSSTNTLSMARTTGFTCSAVARLIAEGVFARPGVSALEHVGRSAECHQAVLRDLDERGVRFVVS